MKKEGIKQALKFSLVGVFNTAVDYGVFYIMIAYVNATKSISQVVATAVAMCGSYILNKHWTFKARDKHIKSQIAKFIVTNIVSMCCTIFFMYVFYDFLHIHKLANSLLQVLGLGYSLEGDVAVIFCKIAASFLSLIINFLGNKFWVFKKVK